MNGWFNSFFTTKIEWAIIFASKILSGVVKSVVGQHGIFPFLDNVFFYLNCLLYHNLNFMIFQNTNPMGILKKKSAIRDSSLISLKLIFNSVTFLTYCLLIKFSRIFGVYSTLFREPLECVIYIISKPSSCINVFCNLLIWPCPRLWIAEIRGNTNIHFQMNHSDNSEWIKYRF